MRSFLIKNFHCIKTVEFYNLSQSSRIRETLTWYQYSNIIKPGVFRIKLNIELIRSSLNTHFQSRILFFPVHLCYYRCLSNIFAPAMTWGRQYWGLWKYELPKTVIDVQKVMTRLREMIKLKNRFCWKFYLMFVWGSHYLEALMSLVCSTIFKYIKSYNSGH